MTYNIGVIDLTGHLCSVLLRLTDVHISFLCSDNENIKTKVTKKFPNAIIISSNEPSIWNKTFVSRDDILQYRRTQLKVERFAQRTSNLPSDAIAQYYHALSFWLSLFKYNNIDVLFSAKIEHGSLIDSIPLDIAKLQKIPSYTFEVMYGYQNATFNAIKCHNTGNYINLKKINSRQALISLDKIINRKNSTYSQEHAFDILESFRNTHLRKMIKKSVNAHILIKSKFHPKLADNNWKATQIHNDINTMLVIYINYLSLLRKIGLKKADDMAVGLAVGNNYSSLFRNAIKLRKLKKYYRKISSNKIDQNDDCIIYALHVEPEASFMNRTVYDSQIYNIEMLASALPENWTLYVKEHPNQFKMYDYATLHFLKQVPVYRRRKFYEIIKSIKNVKLLDDRVPLSQYYDNNLYPNVHAFSTINGTISLEAMNHGFPVILFDVNSTIYKDIPSLFTVSKYDDLKKAIESLQKTRKIDYKNYKEIISEYLVYETADATSTEEVFISEETLIKLMQYSETIIKSDI